MIQLLTNATQLIFSINVYSTFPSTVAVSGQEHRAAPTHIANYMYIQQIFLCFSDITAIQNWCFPNHKFITLPVQ